MFDCFKLITFVTTKVSCLACQVPTTRPKATFRRVVSVITKTTRPRQWRSKFSFCVFLVFLFHFSMETCKHIHMHIHMSMYMCLLHCKISCIYHHVYYDVDYLIYDFLPQKDTHQQKASTAGRILFKDIIWITNNELVASLKEFPGIHVHCGRPWVDRISDLGCKYEKEI